MNRARATTSLPGVIRYQVGHGLERTGLLRVGGARRRLRRAIRREVKARPIVWRELGPKPEDRREAPNPRKAARAIVAYAEDRRGRLEVGVVGGPTLFRLEGDVPAVALPPLPWRLAPGVRRTVRYHTEAMLVIPELRPLGLYVPRPLRDDTPDGWQVGDPWPRGAYASEHAHATADDFGVDRPDGRGYSSDPDRLAAFLGSLTRYVLANFRRLKVRDHIYDHNRWRPSSSGEPMRSAYTGSDDHETHTHTAFDDNGGRKPPWL